MYVLLHCVWLSRFVLYSLNQGIVGMVGVRLWVWFCLVYIVLVVGMVVGMVVLGIGWLVGQGRNNEWGGRRDLTVNLSPQLLIEHHD